MNDVKINTNVKREPIILASASPRRAQLLKQIGVDYRVVVADVDESQRKNESPAGYVVRVAKDKCLEIAQYYPGRVILACDTVVVVDQKILGKPRDEKEHGNMFKMLSGRTHQVLSAVSVHSSLFSETQIDTSEVTFNDLSTDVTRAYWRSGEAIDKAGGYAIQGRAAVFIRHLNGSFSGVMGLPLELTARLLERAGIDMWRNVPV